MVEFVQRTAPAYGTEAKAHRALYKARWPHGFRCPACGDRRLSSFRRGSTTSAASAVIRRHCSAARSSKRPSCRCRTWLLAIHQLTATKTNMAAPRAWPSPVSHLRTVGSTHSRSCNAAAIHRRALDDAQAPRCGAISRSALLRFPATARTADALILSRPADTCAPSTDCSTQTASAPARRSWPGRGSAP